MIDLKQSNQIRDLTTLVRTHTTQVTSSRANSVK